MDSNSTEENKPAKCPGCQRIILPGVIQHGPNCQTQEAIHQRTVNSAGDERVANNVVRHEYRVLSEQEKEQMLAIKDAGRDMIAIVGSLPPGRERSLAITKIEEAVMWAVKGLTG